LLAPDMGASTVSFIPRTQTRGELTMASKTVKVGSAVGLHARPATMIAQAVTELGVPVTIGVVGGSQVDAGSALLIMTLGAKQGADIVVESDDEAALERIAGLVEQDLDA
jgi:phosphocarrier protein HPr